MAQPPRNSSSAADDRQARLARALRQNLHRRKAQQRGKTGAAGTAPDAEGEAQPSSSANRDHKKPA